VEMGRYVLGDEKDSCCETGGWGYVWALYVPALISFFDGGLGLQFRRQNLFGIHGASASVGLKRFLGALE
jgi:hypothetical protein